MQEEIYDIVIEKDDVTWKDLLHDLVKSTDMDPWDINLTLLTQKFIAMIKNMKEHDMRISGKVLLAAAFLLRLKSAHLLDHDISAFDSFLNDPEEEEFLDFEDEFQQSTRDRRQYTLIPRNPQPRSRKVSIHDLVEALQRAMETKKRKLAKSMPVNFTLPSKDVDIMEIIRELHNKINYYSSKDPKAQLTFTKLLPPRAGKAEKVFTFIPMLHLENERKIDTHQDEAFGEIHVKLVVDKKKSKSKV